MDGVSKVSCLENVLLGHTQKRPGAKGLVIGKNKLVITGDVETNLDKLDKSFVIQTFFV